MHIVKPDVSRRTVTIVRFHLRSKAEERFGETESLLKYVKSKGYEVISVLEDVASGFNENRKSLNNFDMVERKKIGVVIIEFKDRLLTRFGFKYLECYFASHGVRVEGVNNRA